MEKAKAHVKVLDEKIENENIEERKSDDRENRIHSRCRYEDDQNLKEQVHWPENMSRKGNRLSDDPLVNIKANVSKFNYEDIPLDNSRVNRGLIVPNQRIIQEFNLGVGSHESITL